MMLAISAIVLLLGLLIVVAGFVCLGPAAISNANSKSLMRRAPTGILETCEFSEVDAGKWLGRAKGLIKIGLIVAFIGALLILCNVYLNPHAYQRGGWLIA